MATAVKTAKIHNCNSIAEIEYHSPNTVRFSYAHDREQVHAMTRKEFDAIAYDVADVEAECIPCKI